MNKGYLIALAIIVSLLIGAYFKLFIARAGFHETIDSTTGVFVIENFENSNIKIVTAKTDKISVDLKGPQDKVDEVRFFGADNNNAKFTLSDEWQELSGTITVPEGTLLDISLSDDAEVIVNTDSPKSIGESDYFLIDTNSVTSVSFDSGSITINSGGGETVWDVDSWEPLDSSADGDEEGDESGGSSTGESEGDDEEDNEDNNEEDSGEDEYVPAPCSVGSQAIRNYCCERLNEDEATPFCDGYGYYVFNNVLRECEFTCEEDEDEEDNEEDNNEDEDNENDGGDEDDTECSIGSQEVRNLCCAEKNTGTDTSYCVGEWQFNNSSRICNYHCFTEEELEEYFGGGSSSEGDDFLMCENYDDQSDRDACCDFNLGNELSIGPKPGFPDCIGKWYFDEEDGCLFRCADYHEMQEIIKELKEKAAENQE